jgi:hypothetical protein
VRLAALAFVFLAGVARGQLTDTLKHDALTPPDLPARNHTFRDPVFGTEILRVTDGTDQVGNGKRWAATIYSTYSAFNADSTRLAYLGGNGKIYVAAFDPLAFRVTRYAAWPAATQCGGYPRWGETPDEAYCLHESYPYRYFQRVDVATGARTELFDLETLLPGGTHRLWQPNGSWDSRYWALGVIRNSDSQRTGFVVLDSSTTPATVVYAKTDYQSSPRLDDAAPVVYGGALYALVMFDAKTDMLRTPDGEVVATLDKYNCNFGHAVTLGDKHVGISPYRCGTTYGVWNYTMPSFERMPGQPVIQTSGLPACCNVHLSASGPEDPWVVLSVFEANPPQGRFRQEIFGVRTDQTASRTLKMNYPPDPGMEPDVVRFVHHYSAYDGSSGVIRGYWGIPKASVSPDGRFVAFSSNWGGTEETGRIDVFVFRTGWSMASRIHERTRRGVRYGTR